MSISSISLQGSIALFFQRSSMIASTNADGQLGPVANLRRFPLSGVKDSHNSWSPPGQPLGIGHLGFIVAVDANSALDNCKRAHEFLRTDGQAKDALKSAAEGFIERVNTSLAVRFSCG